MKKFILFLSVWGAMVTSEAQPLEFQLQRITGKLKEKTLKLNPRMELTIRTLLPENDSMKEEITFKGLYHSGSTDSLVMKLDTYKSFKEFPDGMRQTTTIPPEIYLKNCFPGSGLKSVALKDIGFLSYQKRSKLIGKADDVFEPVIFASLFVIILSPLISYDFKEGHLNTERYKNWALGSTLTMTSCFAVLMAINLPNHPKNYQFRSGWPEKKAKVWKFR